jgi:hypothetical protein
MIIMFDGFHDYQSIVTIKPTKHPLNHREFPIKADRRTAERFSGLYQDDRSRELRTQDKTWVGKMEILGNW